MQRELQTFSSNYVILVVWTSNRTLLSNLSWYDMLSDKEISARRLLIYEGSRGNKDSLCSQ